MQVLEALNQFSDRVEPNIIERMITTLQNHAAAVAKVQSEDGRWHQVVINFSY